MESPKSKFPFDQPFDRQKYLDIDETDETLWDLIQPKYDGIWARLQKQQGNALIYSRTSQVKTVLDLPKLQNGTVLLGEYMYGSQWAQDETRIGRIFVFDCVAYRFEDIRSKPYSERLKYARQIVEETGYPLQLVKSYPFSYYGKVWEKLTATHDFEGLVFRCWSDDYDQKVGRRKLDITDEYVILEAVEGKGKHAGRLGALVVGQYIDGQLTAVMSVGGGFSDEDRENYWFRRKQIVGTVCEVIGKARFSSGALRHPNFVRMRPDKPATECIGKPNLFRE